MPDEQLHLFNGTSVAATWLSRQKPGLLLQQCGFLPQPAP